MSGSGTICTHKKKRAGGRSPGSRRSLQGSFGSFLIPNMWRSTNPINPFPLSTTTFILWSLAFLSGAHFHPCTAGRRPARSRQQAGPGQGRPFSPARIFRIQQRMIMMPSATMMTAATNSVNPEGLMLARIMPSPKAAAHTARWRRSERQPCMQNFGLRKTGTSVSRKLAPKGYSSIYGSAGKCYRAAKNRRHRCGARDRAASPANTPLSLTPFSACRARRSRSRC